jgi:hypothetical protein
MMIRQINNDQEDIVQVNHIHSNGMADVTSLAEGVSYRIHKRHLEVPNALKPKPQKIPFIDALDQMKKDCYQFATLQQNKPSYHYSSHRT